LIRPGVILVLTCASLAACAPPAIPPADAPLQEPPVDSARISVSEVAGWRQRRLVGTDLNGNGTLETVVLASDVTVRNDGTPLWEDGHRWAVFVEEGDQRTLLYAAFVPNGHAEAAVLTADDKGHRHVLIQERTPEQTKSLVVSYERPGTARGVSAAYYQIDQWFPDLRNP
jgi:hypothetical protein